MIEYLAQHLSCRNAESIVMMTVKPEEQCLPKTFVKFSIMNNNHHQ